MNAQQKRTLDEVTRDLDLLVYRLESAPGREVDEATLLAERRRLRRDLEKLRDRLQDLADGLW